MNMTVTSKKVQVGQSFTDYANKKLSKKLDRFFGENAEAKLTVSSIRDEIVVELTVKHQSLIFRAEKQAAEKNEALDACVDKIIRQIRKNKTKVEKRLHDSAFDDSYSELEPEYAEDSYSVDRTKRLVLTPMTVDEAILQMNLLGHNFYMFKNGDTGEVNLVYKRNGGGRAVIEVSKG
ncbi:MAG: ribosome-associated translation inhibitor RaiA [Oscillospiraceae bacterium]|nr:ribosome-associated translation inhibitor RaiA [Oscillospiraceae bacterium]